MERRTPVWEAPEEITALFPDASGNDLNGVGETQERRVSAPMWRNPKSIAHGSVQNYITKQYLEHEVLSTTMRRPGGYEPAPLAEDKTEKSPEEWVEALREFTLDLADWRAAKVRIVEFRPEWAFEGSAVEQKWMVLLADVMDYDELSQAPEWEAAREVHTSYNRGTNAARELADWIQGQGHKAIGHGGPGAGPVLLIPAAIECGFGELAKHGSLIDEDLGTGFRLSVVLTDLPLVADDASDPMYVDAFCQGCRICTDACPPDAMSPDKVLVRGVSKWYVNFDRCLPHFATTYGCAICVAVCPWTKPGQAPRLTGTMRRKNSTR